MNDLQIDYFLDFLAREAELIDAHEFQALEDRTEEKKNLCDAFERHMENILEHWDDITPERRRFLHDIMHKVRHNLMMNHKALVKAMELNHQLVKICLNARSSESIKLQRYDSLARTHTEALPPLHTTIKHL